MTLHHMTCQYYNLSGYMVPWFLEAIINISWADRKLQRACSLDREGQRRLGAPRWRKLKLRLAVLEAAPTLAALEGAPGGWHPLGADRDGQWAAALDGGYRLIFVADHEPLPLAEDGGLDVRAVTRVRIMEIVDYHGR